MYPYYDYQMANSIFDAVCDKLQRLWQSFRRRQAIGYAKMQSYELDRVARIINQCRDSDVDDVNVRRQLEAAIADATLLQHVTQQQLFLFYDRGLQTEVSPVRARLDDLGNAIDTGNAIFKEHHV